MPGFRSRHLPRPAVRSLRSSGPTLELADDTSVVVAAEHVLAREGRDRYVDAVVTRDGEVIGTVSVAAVREELALTFEHRAHHDPLTGLPNRALLADRLEQALVRRVRVGRDAAALGLLVIDLDDGRMRSASNSTRTGRGRPVSGVLRVEQRETSRRAR